jgi:ketosteroid isomerase-like protein
MTHTAQLPATISSYLTAHRDDDADTALAAFTDDATVVDEGHTYRGLGEIDEDVPKPVEFRRRPSDL